MRRWPSLAILALLALLAPGAAADGLAVGAPEAELPAWACIPEDPVCAPATPPAPAPDTWMCVPESLACHVGQVLCPRFGMTAGWCVAAEASDEGADAGLAAGLWRGPRVNAEADARVARDAGRVERAEVEASYGAAWCLAGLLPPLVAMQLPDAPVPLPSCGVADALRATVEP